MFLSDNKKTMIVSCIAFFCIGVSLAAIGPVLSQLAQQTGAGLAEAGAIFTALFLGALVSQIVAGPVGDRFGQPVVLFGGSLLLGIGMFAVVFSTSLWVLLLLTFLGGLGHGAVDLSASVLVARVFAKRSVAALNLLSFFYGLGAFLGPALVGLSITIWHNGLWVIALNAVVMVLLAPFTLRLKLPAAVPLAGGQAKNDAASLYKSPLLWMLGLLLLVYVGVENGLGGWISTYMTETTLLSLNTAALVSSGFWLALTFGRLANTFLGLRLTPQRILYLCIFISILGGLLFALSTGNPVLSIIAILVTGFGFGAIYPTVISIVNTTYHAQAGKATSLAAALGSGGGVIVPWLHGVILANYGASASAWFAALGIILMLVLFYSSQQLAAQSHPAVEGIKASPTHRVS
jgi:MFS transporter, FHS family, glucose/mannose:H+ symporter